MLSGSLLPKVNGNYIVTSPDVSSLHSLGLDTSNTPSKFMLKNFVYNYINVSSSDVSLNYNTSCINHSVILGEILFDTIDDWGTGHIAECILILSKYQQSDAVVVDKEINIMSMFVEIIGTIK